MKHRLASLIALATLAFAASCGGTNVSPSTPMDVRATIAVGQSVALDNGALTLRFDAVPEDSRCPADAMCIWAGRAILKLTVLSARRETSVQVQTDPVDARTATAEGVRIECVALEPYPLASRPTQPADYRATVRVTR